MRIKAEVRHLLEVDWPLVVAVPSCIVVNGRAAAKV
jgi:hypothetical protein